MGRIIVRQHRESKKPYKIPGLQRNVYSMEELVWHYMKNLTCLEEKILDLELCDWLETEMEQEIFAKELRQLIIEGNGIASFLEKILSEIPFYSENELSYYKEILAGFREANLSERKKIRMQHLMDKGDIRGALKVCLELLQEAVEDETASEAENAQLYHNLGVMAAREFYFDIASEYFKKAFKIGKSEESRKQYMLSLRFALPKKEYVERISTEGLGEEWAVQLEEEIMELLQEEKNSGNRQAFMELLNDFENGNRGIFQEKVTGLFNDWKEQWRYG